MTLQVYNDMPILRCGNSDCKQIERVPKAIPGVWFCSDECNFQHAHKISTIILWKKFFAVGGLA